MTMEDGYDAKEIGQLYHKLKAEHKEYCKISTIDIKRLTTENNKLTTNLTNTSKKLIKQ